MKDANSAAVFRQPCLAGTAFKRLGVCVLNWNAGDAVIQCVHTLLEATSAINAEIVVVDNGSTDHSTDLIPDRCHGVSVIRKSENDGFARGNNIGARHLRARECDVLLFVNPDVVLDESAVSALYVTLLNNPRTACVGGLPVTNGGVSKMAARSKASPFDLLVLYGGLSKTALARGSRNRHFLDPQQLPNGTQVHAVSGACVMFRTDAFFEVGGFDETTFLYFEEFLMAERLNARGWQTAICTEARYPHAEAHSSRLIPYRRRLYFIESEQYYLRRHSRLNPTARLAWRLFRYAEWLPLSVRAHWRTSRLQEMAR